MKTKVTKTTDPAAIDSKAPRAPANSRRDHESRRSRQPGKRETGSPVDAAEPESMEAKRDKAFREILTLLRVPLVCEDKRCRRQHRCVGIAGPDQRAWTVPCYERHREVLQPIYTQQVLPLIRARQAELED